MAEGAARIQRAVSFREALGAWIKIAAYSLGGPAGQIAVMHRILVEEKRWLSERRFLHALNYCMLLPGPEAQQLATYSGWLLHGWRGGLTAGLLFILPGFLSILALSVLYVRFIDFALVAGLFYGLKPAVMAIVIGALVRIGQKALHGAPAVALAAAAFIAIFVFDVPFPLIIVAAAAIGVVASRAGMMALPVDAEDEANTAKHPSLGQTLGTVATWAAIWLIPLAALNFALGPDNVFVQLGRFFARAALFTFGGAYAVLAYVAQEAVAVHGWLQPGEMLDGLGMAETTPGPLIQVVQFVGFMGGYRDGAGLDPMWAAIIGSVVVTWVTFAPCFLFIFAGAPYIESLRGNKTIAAALSGITAAVVGVILNLAVWFAVQTLFGVVNEAAVGPLRLAVPDVATLDLAALVIAAASALALLRFKINMLYVLGGSVLAGFAVSALS
ncbi:MAG: chromate efflux transporter [Acidobacteria bacterium]|nr:chromate efflux transporter [Acidobacteriota bacterium]